MATTKKGERRLELQRRSFRFRCDFPVLKAELTDRIAYDVDVSFLLKTGTSNVILTRQTETIPLERSGHDFL